jgi:hypothetical protein
MDVVKEVDLVLVDSSLLVRTHLESIDRNELEQGIDAILEQKFAGRLELKLVVP